MKEKLPWPVKQVHYWSDGAGSQFKNKYNFANLLFHKADFGCAADWSFFATAHGKGPIDGIGATIKRSVWRCVLKDQVVVNDAYEFFKAAEALNDKVLLMYVPASEITSTDLETLLKERWENCITIKGTRDYHYVSPSDNCQVYCATNSPFTDASRVMLVHKVYKARDGETVVSLPECNVNDQCNDSASIPDLAVSNFVVVQFSGEKVNSFYVAQILQIDGDDIEISAMRAQDANKTKFSLPVRDDTTWIDQKQVIKKLPVPQIDHRSRYVFNEGQPVTA